MWHCVFANKEQEIVFYMCITLSTAIGNIIDQVPESDIEEKELLNSSNLF